MTRKAAPTRPFGGLVAHRRLTAFRGLVVALVLGSALVAFPASAPPPAAASEVLPPCRIDDMLTVPRGYDDWATTLVDRILSVGKDYKPPDLVSISRAGLTGGGYIRKVAFEDLRALADAARRNGTPLGSVSAYRSYTTQVKLFNGYAKGYGFDEAIWFSGRPGHSEHQLGLVIDFAPAGKTDFVTADSAAGRWLAKNAWKYGWLLSFPKGKQDITCFTYEPWHYRYYGRELARKIHESGLTTREYLWANFTMVDPTTGQPLATPTVEPSPVLSAEPSEPTATAAPSTAEPGPSPQGSATDPPSPGPGEVGPAGFFSGLDPPVIVASLLLGAAVLVSGAGVAAAHRARRRWQ